MTPIPHDAHPDDPRWEPAFLNLAHGLVMASAKTRLIARLTGLPPKGIRELYKALRGASAPSGPIVQGTARYFAIPSGRTSISWNLQCATFLACYEDIGEITEVRLHRGWRMLAAYRSYIALTQELYEATKVKRLDINQAYALLTHCRFLESRDAEIQRKQCPRCMIKYLVVTSESMDIQRCPVCAINANHLRLVAQGMPPGRDKES